MSAVDIIESSRTERNRATILDDYLTAAELAAELNLALITLSRWRMLKVGPPVTKVGKKVLYKRSSAREWLASQEQRARNSK
jgi:hypothetical protein